MAAVITAAGAVPGALVSVWRTQASKPGVAWCMAGGVVALTVLLLNVALWVPVQPIALGLAILLVPGSFALWTMRGTNAGQAAVSLIVGSGATVAVIAAVLAMYFGASDWWLLEGPNHDSLFYFEGAAWSWQRPLRVSPEEVADVWKLGTCSQGGVFIGQDCGVLRNGTYSMLAFGSALNRPASANEIQVTASIAATLLYLAGTVAFQQIRQPIRRSLAAGLFAMLVVLSPGGISALVNANLGTLFGATAVAMSMGIALARCRSPYFKAALLGLCTAAAGHLYGEAVAAAGVVAALGVTLDALRRRSATLFVTGGAVALAACIVGLNVALVDLFRSFQAVSTVSTGGAWPAWYIDAPLVAWIASPFAGIVLGLDPEVTPLSLAAGGALSLLVLALGLSTRSFRWATLISAGLATALVAFVEVRDYQYGEHKVVQLIGPFAYAFALLLAYRLVSLYSRSAHRRFANATPLLLVSLCVLCSAVVLYRSFRLLHDGAPVHGLQADIIDGLRRIPHGSDVVIDDLGAIGVEKFQKAHYLAFLLRARETTALFPALVDDPLRGGYVRNTLGDTMRRGRPAWLVQMRSADDAVNSPFAYPQDAVHAYNEYRLVNARIAPVVMAAGNGWYQCEATHCWTKSGFEIEAFVGPDCAAVGATLTLELSYYRAPPQAVMRVASEIGVEDHLARDGSVSVKLGPGWTRTRFHASWPLSSPLAVGESQDSRQLFARVSRVSGTCEAPR